MNWCTKLKNWVRKTSLSHFQNEELMLDVAFYFDATQCNLRDAWETVYQSAISDTELRGSQCVCEDRSGSVENIATMIVESGMRDALRVRFPQRRQSGNSPPHIIIRGFTDGFGTISISGELLPQGDEIVSFGRRFAELSPVYYGRVFDRHFNRCQNLTDPERYDINNCTLAGLPIIKGDRVFGNVVDVSKNPGRVIEYSKYVEALGHVMWIRSSFWDLVGITPIEPGQVHRHEQNGDVLTLVLRDSPFTCEDPGSDILEAVRKSLFKVRWDGHIGRLYLGMVQPGRR
jgi:hypothetical protein